MLKNCGTKFYDALTQLCQNLSAAIGRQFQGLDQRVSTSALGASTRVFDPLLQSKILPMVAFRLPNP